MSARPISIVICTWNRAKALNSCLESLARARPASAGHEVVVVNNNCTDSTPDVISRFESDPHLNLRAIDEPGQGISRARNSGIAAARGQIIAFLDDDAVISDRYLNALTDAFNETDADLVAGKIVCVLPTGVRTDVPAAFLTSVSLAGLDLGPIRRALEPDEYAVGANFAVRRDVLESVGGFREDLGYSGDEKIAGEDTEICDRLRSRGHTLIWDPNAAIEHHLSRERCTAKSFRRAAFDYGVGRILRDMHPSDLSAKEIARLRKKARGDLAMYQLLRTALWPHPGLRFKFELRCFMARGKLSALKSRAEPGNRRIER